MTRLPVRFRASMVVWRARLWRPQSVSVFLVLAGLAGALGGGWLVGRWCLGLVLIAESAGAVVVGMARDDGTGQPRRGSRTVREVLEDEALRP